MNKKIKKAKYLLETANWLLNEDSDAYDDLQKLENYINKYNLTIKDDKAQIEELKRQLDTSRPKYEKKQIKDKIENLEKDVERLEKLKDENIKKHDELVDYVKSGDYQKENDIILTRNFKNGVLDIIHDIPDKRQRRKFYDIINNHMNLSDIVEKTRKIANEEIGNIEKQKKVEEIIIEELKKSYKQYSNRRKIFVSLSLFIIIIGFFIFTFILAKLHRKTFFQFIKSTHGILFTLLTIILLGFVLIEGYKVFFYDKKDYQILEEKIKNSNLVRSLFIDVSKKVQSELEASKLNYYQKPN